jgi:hypothetical protein
MQKSYPDSDSSVWEFGDVIFPQIVFIFTRRLLYLFLLFRGDEDDLPSLAT